MNREIDRTNQTATDGTAGRDARKLFTRIGWSWLSGAEWVFAVGATAVLFGLHVVFLTSAGAFWRDEVHSVNVAALSSLREIWAHMPFDSFPVFWFLTLHGWMQIVPASSDFGIRILGVLVGLGIVAVLWRNARAFGYGIPLVSLALFGFNAAVISFGDAIRGHGLGMLTGLLGFGLIWDAAVAPTRRHTIVASLASLAAVHFLYYNAAFVLAACAGGVAVAISRRSWRLAARIVSVGIVCALSLLPYTLLLGKARQWDEVIRVAVDLKWIWFKVQEAFAGSGPAALWIWIGSMIASLAAVVFVWLPKNRERFSERERNASLYSGVAMIAGGLAYVVFLKRLSYVTQPWYYVGLMAIVGAALEAPFSAVSRLRGVRQGRLVLVVAITTLVVPFTWRVVRARKTNVDLAASTLKRLASRGDLIVVNPWYLGITFNRYNQTSSDWVTIPPISDHRFHREDLLKEQMLSRGAIAPVLDRMELTLRGGHHVFWVGDLFIPEGRGAPPDPPPAPHPRFGWSDAPYYEAWGLQAGYLIKTHARAGERIDVPVRQPVNPYEEVGVYAFTGWWEPTAARSKAH